MTTFETIIFIPKCYGVENIFITPDLYSNANKFFVGNLLYAGYINVQDNLQTFRQILNDNEININRLYEFKCSTSATVTIQEEDFVLPGVKSKVEFSHRTASDEGKKFF